MVISGQIPGRRRQELRSPASLAAASRSSTGTQRGPDAASSIVLAQLRAACGDLARVIAGLVRLGGFIACTPDFTQHALVMNGASDLAVAVFGDAGRHARSTIGVASLPGDASVEVEAIFEVLA